MDRTGANPFAACFSMIETLSRTQKDSRFQCVPSLDASFPPLVLNEQGYNRSIKSCLDKLFDLWRLDSSSEAVARAIELHPGLLDRPSRPVNRSVLDRNIADTEPYGRCESRDRLGFSSKTCHNDCTRGRPGERVAANGIVAERIGAHRGALGKITCDAILEALCSYVRHSVYGEILLF